MSISDVQGCQKIILILCKIINEFFDWKLVEKGSEWLLINTSAILMDKTKKNEQIGFIIATKCFYQWYIAFFSLLIEQPINHDFLTKNFFFSIKVNTISCNHHIKRENWLVYFCVYRQISNIKFIVFFVSFVERQLTKYKTNLENKQRRT